MEGEVEKVMTVEEKAAAWDADQAARKIDAKDRALVRALYEALYPYSGKEYAAAVSRSDAMRIAAHLRAAVAAEGGSDGQ